MYNIEKAAPVVLGGALWPDHYGEKFYAYGVSLSCYSLLHNGIC